MDRCLILFHWSRYSSSVLRSFEASESQLQIKNASFLTLGRVDAGFLKQLNCVQAMQQSPSTGMRAACFSHVAPNSPWFDPEISRMSRWICHRSASWLDAGSNWKTSFQYQRTRRPFSTWYCGRMPKLALSCAVLSLVSQLSSFRLIQHPEQFPSDNMMLSLHLCT